MTTTKSALELADLGGRDLGRTITIPTSEGEVTGLLVEIKQRIEVEDLIALRGQGVARSKSRPVTTITLRGWAPRDFWGDTAAAIFGATEVEVGA